MVNLNQFIPEANRVTVPVFSPVNLLRDQVSAGPSFRDLGQYDRILIRITFYSGNLPSPTRLQSFDFLVNIDEWDGLTTVPLPDQAKAESATNRVGIIATTKDNRALVHEFPQLPDGSWTDTLPDTGNPRGGPQRAFETAVQAWVDNFRAGKRLVYIGKSNETNPRLLIGLSGTSENFLAEVKGYH